MFRERLEAFIEERWPNHLFDIATPPDPAMGDMAVNLAFSVAKSERTGPMLAAQTIADAIKQAFPDEVAAVVPTPPGFVNITLTDGHLRAELARIADDGSYGHADEGAGRTAIVEYSSPNIAKSMHVGHLRSTIIGDALANAYEARGYDVIRWNYVGDWGTQFGNLIAAYRRWGQEADLENKPIAAMEALYVRFHKEAADDPTLEQEGRDEFRKLESGDRENRGLWERFRAKSLEQFSAMYERLHVGLVDGNAVVKGESDYEKDLEPLITELSGAGIASPGEKGALIVDLEAFDIKTPGLLRKGDGATLYLTRDVASLCDRIKKYAPDRMVYVVANQQALHFEQLFALAELMKQKGLVDGETLPDLRHVKFGLVVGPDGKKFSTREGNAVALADLYDEAVRRAHEVVRSKNPALDDAACDDIARTVAVGALKYNDLRQHPHSDIVFDWDAMLSLSGDSGPYLQYTYSRLASIVAKAPEGKADLEQLTHPAERALMRHLLDFPGAIGECVLLSGLNPLALYLYRLAGEANRYYESVRVLEDENGPRKAARVVLVRTVADVLKRGLGILGIQALERI